MGAESLDETSPLRVRAFFGLPVPEAQREILARYVERCAALAGDFRWVAPANLHLTVRFLGHVERQALDVLVTRLTKQRLRGFDLELSEVGTFKRGQLVRVVWIGLRRDVVAASALAATVEAECRSAGLEPEERRFQPHLTLARARGREGSALPSLPDAPRLDPWQADELVLYQSHLGRAGSVYEPLANLRLD